MISAMLKYIVKKYIKMKKNIISYNILFKNFFKFHKLFIFSIKFIELFLMFLFLILILLLLLDSFNIILLYIKYYVYIKNNKRKRKNEVWKTFGYKRSFDEFSTSTNYINGFKQVNIKEYSAPNQSMTVHWSFIDLCLLKMAVCALNYSLRLYLIFRRMPHNITYLREHTYKYRNVLVYYKFWTPSSY